MLDEPETDISQSGETPEIPRHRVLAKVVATDSGAYERVLTADARLFLAELQRRFNPTRRFLLQARKDRQDRFDYGEMPRSLPETEHVRKSVWQIAPVPKVLRDRRVEITGPVDRKMMINALNSGAKMFMADFEDASSPTWANMMDGQINMMDFARGTLSFEDTAKGKSYSLNDETAVMIVRPRGWHLDEAHIEVDGKPMSASLVDFGLHIFHNGKKLAERGDGPFYYLPKMESYLEARLWNDVFNFAQTYVGIPHGTIKATVLIETLPAAFEMDEILYELRDHMAGLNCGRWDYIFSYIKTLRNHKKFVLPDRGQVGMDRGFLRAYSLKLIETCHRRGAHAMGGMAAFIPVKNDDAANEAAFAKVKADKKLEVTSGHDGTWVAHPALVPVAKEVFDAHMPGVHQINKKQVHRRITDEGLLTPHDGTITEAGARTNIAVGIEYIAAWLAGRGAVPINNLMEDAATAEISRVQIWQWLRHKAELDDGRIFTQELFDELLDDEVAGLKARIGDTYGAKLDKAVTLFVRGATAVDLPDFLTLPAYQALLKLEQ